MKVLKFLKTNFHILVIVGSLLLMLYYVSYTKFDLRTHDISGHLDYIKYLVDNKSIPKSDSCWQCYHPPLYYFVASLLYSTLNSIKLNADQGLQYLSVLFSVVFVIFSYKTFTLVFKSRKPIIVATALVAFWPSVIMHSARIGNDTLFYMLFSIGYYTITLWWNTKRNLHLLFALIFASLAVLTKSNGIILWAIILLFVFMRLTFEKRIIHRIIAKLWILIPIAITLGLLFVRKLLDPSIKSWPVGNIAGLPEMLRVGTELKNFIYFDLKAFFTISFIDPWYDTGGRQYFWNYLLKSSLFGEFKFDGSPLWLINALQIFLIGFIILFIFQAVRKLIKFQPRYLIHLVAVCMMVLSLIYLRITAPYSPSNDFRYILPVLIPFIAVVVSIIEELIVKNKTVLTLIFSALFAEFCILSINFFVLYGMSL